MKQIIGSINEKLTSETPRIFRSSTPLPPKSIILPCNKGIKAPPTIAITNPAAPILDSFSSKSSNAIPYIVGNIKDIKNEVPTKAYKPKVPLINIAPMQKTAAIEEN